MISCWAIQCKRFDTNFYVLLGTLIDCNIVQGSVLLLQFELLPERWENFRLCGRVYQQVTRNTSTRWWIDWFYEKILPFNSPRDFNIMSGLAVVEGCLALAFYRELPGPLIDRVFNISFIQRVEDELEQCYSKDFYPQRVLNSVMQLNRAVCLDYPENKVPWFQQNYIEAQLSNRKFWCNSFGRVLLIAMSLQCLRTKIDSTKMWSKCCLIMSPTRSSWKSITSHRMATG